MDRARRRELKHAGVLAARHARVDLAASIARLEADDAASVGGKALASRLAFAVGALYGAEVGEPEGVRDRLREASGVLSGVLAHLSQPGTPRVLDEAGASIAKCLAVLYPARAGLERELEEGAGSSEAPIVELPARVEPSGEHILDGARQKRNTARGVAPSASGRGMAHDPAADTSAERVVEPSTPERSVEVVAEEAALERASVPGERAGRRIPPTREHPLPARMPSEPPRAGQRTLVLGGAGEAADTEVALPAVIAPSTPPPASTPPASTRSPSAPPGPPRARRRALELVPDADEGLVDRSSGSPLVDGANRRTSDRVTLTADIGMHSATQFFTGLGGDVSSGGLFVATWSPLPLGTEVTVSFVLPGGHQVTAPGEVAWLKEPREESDESTPGMGIRFTALTGADRRAIDRFLEKRPALFHDV